MAKKPLLIFPRASSGSRDTLQPFIDNINYPGKEAQVQKFENRISELDRMLENQTAYLGANPANLVAEMILVLEVAGDLKDFFRAVAATPGMEFLGELQSEIDPDENFYTVDGNGARTNKRFGARLFLTMTNQAALRELRTYWEKYKLDRDEQNFVRNTSRFRVLFDRLKDLRPYSIADRIYDTGLQDYLDEMRLLEVDPVKFEIELAFKNNAAKDARAYEEVNTLLQQNNGRIIENSRVIISEIAYHAFIAEAPIGSFDDLTENTNITFLKSQQILFFRPVGQTIFDLSEEPQLFDYNGEAAEGQPGLNPIVALLDGLPLENHALLVGKINVDDPDDFARNYLAQNRVHGTAMASLIINGDLSDESAPLNRPIYVRPILKPIANNQSGGEFLPDDKLPIDLIHRAVRRMFEGEEGNPPTAPQIKLINFSIGDPFRPFHQNISTWAKLIDWLSYRYNVLFIISAGNKVDDIVLDIPEADFDQTSAADVQTATLRKMIQGNFDRKILTPAESINSITVGSSHDDSHGPFNFPQRKNLIGSPFLLSPISRIGFGYNNSIKPDILMAGGRHLFRKHIRQADPEKTHLRIETGESIVHPPGNLAAMPGSAGDTQKVGYLTGTSNAAALTSNLGAKLYEMLLELNTELPNDQKIPDGYFTVILKALLVHGSSWGEAQEIITQIIRTLPGISPQTVKRNIYPYLGYGTVDSEKILYCTDHRVTLIGFGELTTRTGQDAHTYSFPLPPSLGTVNIDKRLAISLAWISPLNFKTAQYRKAHLFFDNLENNGHLALSRNSHDFKLGRKGTVQHDVLTGEYADVFQDGDTINIKVSCREDASGLSTQESIKYALAVTLEIRENVHTMIYEEIQLRLQQRIRERI
ncbi:S8 family peptidase [Pedobacter sp. ISL-68]|uniref:S8 family peptidase n=1 Tax=unclassified Pedobacter TaxID=2628915 RepID=UPI001BE75D70|nr:MULTISPECIES: S8 family peptidase [unclassified Pedobacter]MBT2560210.1 S8 family peptidase [Pedobacter sp. ISL-64]MBT2589190.1 S8 family peptidase [Pedobacter sp. ISL-68]